MDLDLGGLHVAAAYAAVLLGVAGPVPALLYAVRVEHRNFWRRPMLLGAALTLATTLTVYVSGRRLVDDHPQRLAEPGVMAHLEYADRLLLPGAGFFVVAMLTGVLDARTGALRTMLPLLLTGFAVVVLTLTVLSGNPDARLIVERITEQYQ